MKEPKCTVCETNEPIICCATCEALYCEPCRQAFHTKEYVYSQTCPSQQTKRTGSPQTASKQRGNKAAGIDTAKKAPPKPKSSERLSHEVKPATKLPQAKKGSNYDASESDSDENDGKLSPKDDVGYETGSFDEIDASSPAAGDENKTILSKKDECSSSSYSYADLEFRPLIVTDEGGISAAPVDRLSYAYAGNEFRPLLITDDGGIAAPVEAQKSWDDKRQPTSYEEVEILGGKFDRANVVQLMPSAFENGKNSAEKEDFAKYETEQNNRQHDFNITESKGDIYATVQKDRNKTGTPKDDVEPEIPPQIPSRKEITRSDLYEHITGELQNMIEACNEGKSGNGPPPLPQPYSGPGVVPTEKCKELEVASNDEDCNSSPLYAAVLKKPKDKIDEKHPDEIPPPLPARGNLDDALGRVEQDRGKHSGVGIFKKLHRRKFSDGNFINNSGEIFGYPSPGSSKKGHKRSKSQDDITNSLNFPPGKETSNSLIQPYLEVDITEPPKTPIELQSCNVLGGQASCGLPDGWKEVESENGAKYYWHISSGTTQWERPQVAPRPKKKSGDQVSPVTDQQKVLSFPIHSMGWIELEESQVAPHNMSDTIAECISTLAKARKDLWQTSETWGEGKDIRLLLEGDTLKLVEPRNKITLLVQPVSKMRVWGVGKEDHRDFAYVARDPNTSKHKCHMFRCHGNISGRAITTALHEMCNRILEEKKRAQEISKKNSPKLWSDIINTPAPPSAKDNASFNEKPVREQRRDFTATYLGSTDVQKPTGMEMLNRAINKVASRGGHRRTVLIQITVSCVKLTDCTVSINAIKLWKCRLLHICHFVIFQSQEEISEDRVRYLSFMGIGKDERLCGYVMANEPDQYVCHVFQCAPNAAALTRALEEACQLRYQKCLDAYPEMAAKAAATQEPEPDKIKDKEKSNFISSVQGLLGKLGTKKGGVKKDDVIPGLPKPSHTFMIKYYGALPVAVGTGVETVEEAAKHLTGGTLLICQLDVAVNGVTLYDSQRSALSRRHMDADTISYCGLTSDSGHFGLIQCQGGGKYVCHVFSEYKATLTRTPKGNGKRSEFNSRD
ncbi:hypothetical protein QZH41_017960 [Actinostola sp. cb2023]|nr:hypothetical protein QZH41_017960 [Actinostola sp. cb2023]